MSRTENKRRNDDRGDKIDSAWRRNNPSFHHPVGRPPRRRIVGTPPQTRRRAKASHPSYNWTRAGGLKQSRQHPDQKRHHTPAKQYLLGKSAVQYSEGVWNEFIELFGFLNETRTEMRFREYPRKNDGYARAQPADEPGNDLWS